MNMAQTPVRVGLLGLGVMGRNHLRVLSMLKGVEIAFIADSNAETARALGETYGVRALSDLTAISGEVDAVIICTPTVTHADMVRRMAPLTRNIFVEKPIAGTLAEAEELAQFCSEHDLRIQVGFIERFNPAVQGLKNILDRSEGVVSLDFTRTNKLSSRISDVDVVTDLMIHDIDLALYLNGPARSVAAHGYATDDMIDLASALITHENGRFSRIEASRITDKKKRLIEATCLDMFVECDLLRKEIQICKQAQTRQEPGQPYVISAQQESVEVRPQEALLSELQAFVDACRRGSTEAVPSVAAGVDAMRICQQIQQSVRAQW